jgi:hypothetical protein
MADEDDRVDEYEPRERGLLAGYDWMRLGDHQEQVDLVYEVLNGNVPGAVEAQVMEGTGLRERLEASIDPEAEPRFWEGFSHGARAWMAKQQTGLPWPGLN